MIKKMKVRDVQRPKWTSDEKKMVEQHKLWTPYEQMMIVSNASAKTVSQFERELKMLNNNLFIEFNPNPSDPEYPTGHPIRFRDPKEKKGYIFTGAAVGKSGDKNLPAMTSYNDFHRYDYFGWEAALEQVKEFLKKHKRGEFNGIV